MKTDLKKIRESINSKRAEYFQFKKALPDLAETKAAIIDSINNRFIAPYANMRERFVSAMYTGNPSVAIPDKSEIGNFVFGLMVSDGYLQPILDDIETELSADKSVARMNRAERKQQMEKVLADIFKLEIIEQEIIGDNEQRDDVSGCALLGLPFDIAETAGFI